MCDNCNARALVALEAIANGEEIPEPEGPELELAPYALPFPVVVKVDDADCAMIVTNADGWRAIKGFLESIGRSYGP